MSHKQDPDVKHLKAIWRAFSQLSDDAKRPTLRWLIERHQAEIAQRHAPDPSSVAQREGPGR